MNFLFKKTFFALFKLSIIKFIFWCLLFLLELDSNQVDTFVVDETTGKVKVAQPLDSVHRNHYSLMVKAEDDSDPPKFDTAEVSLQTK